MISTQICRFYWLLRVNRQNNSYSGINCALGPSKSIHYSGVCLHMFYCNSAGLSDFFRHNGVFVIIVIVTCMSSSFSAMFFNLSGQMLSMVSQQKNKVTWNHWITSACKKIFIVNKIMWQPSPEKYYKKYKEDKYHHGSKKALSSRPEQDFLPG